MSIAGDAISYATRYILQRIPERIIKDGLSVRTRDRRYQQVPPEALLRDKVIKACVIPDCSATGGKTITIIFDQGDLKQDSINPPVWIYEVPAEKRDYLDIVSVLEVTSYFPSITTVPYNMRFPTVTGSVMQRSMSEALSSQSPPAMSGTSKVELGLNNSIVLYDITRWNTTMMARLRVCHDELLSDLMPTAWPDFGKMCLLATKMILHKELMLPVDQGKLESGMELGAYSAIIQEWSGAAQEYEEFLRDWWPGVAAQNNTTTMSSIMQGMMGLGH